jgi:2-dehydro-3-deoxyphosphogluconate aldolase/(4S)-4-hydroxy-2-oxoglutarate aldolase
MDIFDKLGEVGIVPVIALDDAKDAIPLGEALQRGGLPCAEITFRTAAAEEAIRLMTKAFPDMIIGAGTVLTTEQVDRAVAAGAQFIVAPGCNPRIVRYCVERNIPMAPGVATASEIEQALECGVKKVKFFPAEANGGLAMIKALAAPYVDVAFMPTGGLNRDNVKAYLSYERVFACGGSWMVKKNLISEGRFDEIEQMAKEAAEIVKQVRG